MQAHTLKIQWLRYSGNPSVVCRSILRKFNGAGIREILPWTGRQYFANSMAQVLGTCFCCMQDHTWKDQWLRSSRNPSVVCRNILRKFSGSDTLEIFLLYARACFENLVAQILWKSFCCVQERTSKIQWRRYSGNPSVVCKTILWKLSGSDTREIFLLDAGAYFENSMAQILGKCFSCLQGHTLRIQWLRYSGNPSVVCKNILSQFSGSDARDILLLYGRSFSENRMAQILWKSFCCARERIIKIPWPRYQGNPSAVCMIIL